MAGFERLAPFTIGRRLSLFLWGTADALLAEPNYLGLVALFGQNHMTLGGVGRGSLWFVDAL